MSHEVDPTHVFDAFGEWGSCRRPAATIEHCFRDNRFSGYNVHCDCWPSFVYVQVIFLQSKTLMMAEMPTQPALSSRCEGLLPYRSPVPLKASMDLTICKRMMVVSAAYNRVPYPWVYAISVSTYATLVSVYAKLVSCSNLPQSITLCNFFGDTNKLLK